MSRRKIKAGSTSNVVPIFVQDTSKTDGSGLGSLVYNTSGLSAKYRRSGDASWTTITLATATAGTWASGGFVADGGPITGGYELGVPDAACAASATWVEIAIYGAANMLPVLIEIELDAVNYQDATRFGLAALPNASAGASGGLPLSVDIAAAFATVNAAIAALNDLSASEIFTTQMSESYAADGTAPTLAQCLFLIQQSLHEFAISGTSRTVKKLDGSTTAAVFTLDSATAPTSTTRTA